MELVSCFNEKIARVRKKGLLLQLNADKSKAIEQDLQLLKFPGGMVEIGRCTNGDHWAHITAYEKDRCPDTVFESANRRLTSVAIDGASYALPHPEALTHLAVRIAPRSAPHAAAESVSAHGWSISFPGGYALLEEAATGLAFRLQVTSEVIETRLDHAYPHGTTMLPPGSFERLDVRLSAPL